MPRTPLTWFSTEPLFDLQAKLHRDSLGSVADWSNCWCTPFWNSRSARIHAFPTSLDSLTHHINFFHKLFHALVGVTRNVSVAHQQGVFQKNLEGRKMDKSGFQDVYVCMLFVMILCWGSMFHLHQGWFFRWGFGVILMLKWYADVWIEWG